MGAVNEAVTAVALPRATAGVRPRLQRTQAAAVLGFLLANGVTIVWLWAHGGNLEVHKTADVLTSFARLTGLLSAYLALVQVLLLARLPALERAIGLDRLSVWHRWNGHAVHRSRRRARPAQRLGLRDAGPARFFGEI